jgi:hypothetical protein
MPYVEAQKPENCELPTKHLEAQRFWQRLPLKYVGQTHVNDSTPSLHVPKLRQGLERQSLLLLAQLGPENPERHRHWPSTSSLFVPHTQLLMETAGNVVEEVPCGQAVHAPLPPLDLKVAGGHATHDMVALRKVNPGAHTQAVASLLGTVLIGQVVQGEFPGSGLTVPLGQRAQKSWTLGSPLMLVCPAGQVQALEDTEPGGLVVPAGHVWHPDWPSNGLKVLPGQGTQATPPSTKPALQTHLWDSSTAVLLARHAVHA